MPPTALIAEDEPLLAANLQAELRVAWPELEIAANVGNGRAAVEGALALKPDVLFLDIRMPGMSGLDAARALAEDTPAGTTLPLIVFVTAYDQYAVEAFERAAFDYLLKPVQSERLVQTCLRLKSALAARTAAPDITDATLERLHRLLEAHPSSSGSVPKLSVIQASVGTAIHLIPVAEVLYFEAADKYVRVITAEREYLIRTSLRELLPQLDTERFWQIHRGTVVRHDAIATAVRDESGKVVLTLRGHADRLIASRLYAHLFKAM